MKSGEMTPLMARAAVPLTTGSGAGSWRGPPRTGARSFPAGGPTPAGPASPSRCGPPSSPWPASTPDGAGFVNPALCQIGRSTSRHQAFHDVTAGTSTATFPGQTIARYQAGPGRDPVTGQGSPSTQALVPPLARYASSWPRPAGLILPAGTADSGK